MNWFERHLNWTWVVFTIIIVVASAANVLWASALPTPTRTIMQVDGYRTEGISILKFNDDIGEYVSIPGDMREVPIFKAVEVVDMKALLGIRIAFIVFFGIPMYIVGMTILSKWMLSKKRRSGRWVLPSATVFPFIPLILNNNRRGDH
jgi:hypothetical protein